MHPNKWTDMIAPHPEVSTAYTVYVMRLMKEIARELGKEKDEKIRWGALCSSAFWTWRSSSTRRSACCKRWIITDGESVRASSPRH